MEVHRGLAASGHPEKEERAKLARAERLLERNERCELLLVQFLAPRGRDREPRRRLFGRAARRAAGEPGRGGDGRLEHIAQVGGVVVGHPAAKIEKLGGAAARTVVVGEVDGTGLGREPVDDSGHAQAACACSSGSRTASSLRDTTFETPSLPMLTP